MVLNPRMTVRRIIGRPLKLHRVVPSVEIDAEVGRLLDLVGLRPPHAYIDRFPHGVFRWTTAAYRYSPGAWAETTGDRCR